MPQHAQNILPPTPKQVDYARQIASRIHAPIPAEIANDRRALSAWIDQHKRASNAPHITDGYATSRQVAFAERIARIKRRAIPQECFRDVGLMSRWISANQR